MKLVKILSACLLVSAMALPAANAATIELADGKTVQGEIKQRDDQTLVVDVNGMEVRIPKSKIKGIDFGGGQASGETAQTAAQSTQQAQPQQQVAAQPAVVPAGTTLTVRMKDTISTEKSGKGQRFTAVLQGNLMAGDVVVAENGSTVYGRIVESDSGGRLVGSATMSIELTEVMIDNQLRPIVTQPLSSESEGSGGGTAKRSVGGAAVGGLIGGSDGAKTGAAVGLGASLIGGGSDIEVASGTILDFRLRTDFHG